MRDGNDWLNDNSHDVKYSELEEKKIYNFILKDITYHETETYKGTTYLIFDAVACEDYPELNGLEKNQKTILHISDTGFKRQWLMKNEIKFLNGKSYDIDIKFKRQSNRNFVILNISLFNEY